MRYILLVVEGEGDVAAAPITARRVLHELYGIYDWGFETHRRRGVAHLKGNDWANFKRYLAAAYNEGMPILWMIDCDDDCALTLAQEFGEQATVVGIRQPLAFCFWVREYETIFMYDSNTLETRLGCTNLSVPPNPEDVRGVKEWISRHMSAGQIYKPLLNQPALSSVIDLQRVRGRYESFQHFERALQWLIQQTRPGLYPVRI